MDDYEVRIDDKFLKGNHKDGEVLTSSELNELENVVKTAINANYEDIQKLGNGEIPVGDADTLSGASLSKYNDEALQNNDTKIPSSMQVKQYVDGAISNIDLDGYYTKREVDDIVATYDSDGNGIVDNAEKVNNHTVDKDVPADAKFTDTIVTKTSELTNDSGFLTSETDPVFNASPAKTITSSNINNWNNKQAALVSGSNIKTINGASVLGSGNLNVPVNLTAGDNITINNNVISATDTKYTGGTNVTIDSNNAINVDLSGKQNVIDSSHKLNADLVDDTNSTNKFTSASEKSTWNGKYAKPSGGIPKTDLATDVQTSLGKADTAIQDVSGKQDIMQYSTVPTASSTLVDKIIQYTGATDGTYTNGYFYKCVNNGGTYTWENINVQTNNGGGTGGASILLKTINSTAPSTGLAEGDKYYSLLTNKIYTYDGSEWDEGETPEVGQYYITTDVCQSYTYDTVKACLVPTNIFTYVWDGTAVSSGDSRLDIFTHLCNLIKRHIPASLKVWWKVWSTTNKWLDDGGVADLTPVLSPRSADLYQDLKFTGFASGSSGTNLYFLNAYLQYDYTYQPNKPVRSVPALNIDMCVLCSSYNVYYGGTYGNKVLPTDNTREYLPSNQYNPATVKFVNDKVNEKTAILNYDGGEHNKIYFNASNTLGTSLPETSVESPYHGPNYNMDYTYTSAQSIMPETKYLLHFVKMAKYSTLLGQTISATVSIIRNGTTLISKDFTVGIITQLSNATANDTTVSLDCEFSFGLDEPLAIQANDIFRIVLKSSYSSSGNSWYGTIYSSSTNPTYIEQFSGGIDANNVYDKINNVNYTQHDINATIEPTITSDSTTTDYTISSLTGNKVYKLGELTSLTLTAVTTFDRESIIYFSSGSTPTDISIPDSLTNLGDVPTLTTASNVSTGTCEASKSYIIAVLNNIAVWKAY